MRCDTICRLDAAAYTLPARALSGVRDATPRRLLSSKSCHRGSLSLVTSATLSAHATSDISGPCRRCREFFCTRLAH
ncbi:hypothetical protein COCMIDRAFT_104510 [Bipolaris oryzae ATCC 44560]|uniref:Uncharacterized protein n=1 Tax=Bipolaris oryzae ATCC 44560 TaxID=930090 RepID=W6ZEX7_COCMI|nr:uncharacterized protein COCMIDRAFT_104510 [Bipolaris oryzae ATCC 44560]EUC42066.1 hypothetical protein COCMIDRAFT_104510 [Bipolaris oryzae ATCC 44560]